MYGDVPDPLLNQSRAAFRITIRRAVLISTAQRKDAMFNDTTEALPHFNSIAAFGSHNETVRVPLSPVGSGTATVYRDDFERLLRMGVARRWFLVRNGKGQSYVRAYLRRATGGQITVARAILDCGKGERVSYRGEDRTDLRRDKIHAERGYAKRDDADLLREFRDAEAEAALFGADAS
jgi:hypothetical protein